MDIKLIRFIVSILAIFFAAHAKSIDITNGCSNSNWVAIKTKTSQSCPKAENWSVRSLFKENTTIRNLSLENYCTYTEIKTTIDRNQKVPEELKKLIEQGLIENNPQKDCFVITSLASTIAPDVTSTLHKQLMVQSGKIDLPPIKNELYPVRMAILDTLPTREYSPSNAPTRSSHGVSLATIAENLLCDDSSDSCYAHLTSRLALAYSSDKRDKDYSVYRDDIRGGFFGSLTDLASAIRNETIAWKSYEPRSRLVLNLSLGWNSLIWSGAGTQPETYLAGVKGVYSAIEDAVCHGALVIAAAGNKGNSKVEDQHPMLPAAWQDIPSPSDKRCNYLLDKQFEGNNGKGSMVYGVSAIDSVGRSLTNTRSNAKSRFSAYGDHAIVETSGALNNTVLTGSSVSTLLVSSIASMVWAHRPELTSSEIMELIYKSGDNLGIPADFYGNASGTDILMHRASMCSALKYACNGLPCGNSINQCPWNQYFSNLNSTSLVTTSADQSYLLSDIASCSPVADPTCKLNQQDSLTISPWIIPQPDSTVCPNCSNIQANQSLMIQTSSSYSGVVTEASLIIGEDIYQIPPFVLGDKIAIKNFPLDGSVSPVYLSFLIDGDYRETVPLLISE